jgi:glycerol-3-phosphate dehydrogenase (NAD(P)+)
MIATGVPTPWIEQEIGEVAEGLTAAPVVRDVARERGIELPITEAVCKVAFDGVAPLDALAELMTREPVEE